MLRQRYSRGFATYVDRSMNPSRKIKNISIVACNENPLTILSKNFDSNLQQYDLILAVCQEDFDAHGKIKSKWLKETDSSLSGLVQKMASDDSFTGKNNTCSQSFAGNRRIFLGGLGPSAGPRHHFAKFASNTASFLTKGKFSERTSLMYAPWMSEGQYFAMATHLFADLARSFPLISPPKKTDWSKIQCQVFVPQESQQKIENIFEKASGMASGLALTRHIVDAPSNIANPMFFAKTAKHINGLFPSLTSVNVLEIQDCKKLNMGLFLGVAQAATNPPKFVHLTYKGDKPKKRIAVIGKGVTFDSGGYNLKAGPGSMIELMKMDCGGAAAILGAALALCVMKPVGIQVDFYIAACENMISGDGLRPGDVVVSSNGVSVEVNNTDAEGRLTMADALVYAQKEKAHHVIDIATLTGACIVGLGEQVAGMYSNDDKLVKQLEKASANTTDRIWHMPLVDEYEADFKSSVADMKNTGSRLGGSIGAALFLRKFINPGVSWAHIDMAGPVWDTKQNRATGFGAMLLTEHFLQHSEPKA